MNGKMRRETSQKRSAAVAILDARRMRFEQEATPVGVDERVALAPVDLLSSIVTAGAAGLGGLDALAVDDRLGVVSSPLEAGGGPLQTLEETKHGAT